MEGVLRRERGIVIGGIVVMTALAWAYILTGAGTGMSVWSMTSASLFPHRVPQMPMDAMSMLPGAWAPAYWIVMLLMWWVMMIAMMTPSAAPMILLNARATRHARDNGSLQQRAVPTTAFVGGYLLAWLGFSFVATLFTWALVHSQLIAMMTMSSTSAPLSAAILFCAGIYQITPLKRTCLVRCRNPAEFLSRHWKPGPVGALRMGLEHGAFCVGCCWVLMALLFIGGIMNVLWIGLLALFVIVEKLAARGPACTWIASAVLIVWGTVTLFI